MGVNSRNSDAPTQLMQDITRSRELRDLHIREQVRNGEISVKDYLVKYKGFSPEHADMLVPKFELILNGI